MESIIPTPNASVAQLTYATTVTMASIICIFCYTSPNPTPKVKLHSRDTLMSTAKGRFGFWFNRLAIALIGPAYVYAVLYPETTFSARHGWCPHPDHINPRALRWTTFTTTCMVIMIVFGILRLRAYRQLGQDFTYELATPQRLVTTGLYRYIRHPSYTAKMLVAVPLSLFFLRDDGPAGCWLPGWVVRFRLLSASVWAVKILIALGMKDSRVREEEEMMAQAFGEEWIKYAARTKKYVPYVY